jgi:hypothetical protein
MATIVGSNWMGNVDMVRDWGWTMLLQEISLLKVLENMLLCLKREA